MKQTVKTILGLLSITFLISGCGKSSDNTTTTTTATASYVWNGTSCVYSATNTVVNSSLCGTTTTTTNQYVWNGTSCIYSATNTAVSSSLCGVNTTTGTTNTGYSYYNGLCYSYNGQIVDSSYCGQTNTQYQQGQQCYGTYYSQYGSMVQCSGYNCSGQVVYDPNTMAALYCP